MYWISRLSRHWRIVSLRAHYSTQRQSQTLAHNKMTAHASRPVVASNGQGDLNNTAAARAVTETTINPAYSYKSFALQPHEDDAVVRDQYRPFLLPDRFAADDWVAQLELSTTLQMVQSEILDKKLDRLRILVLYGSLRNRYAQQDKTLSAAPSALRLQVQH